jgi:hypothetical protein
LCSIEKQQFASLKYFGRSYAASWFTENVRVKLYAILHIHKVLAILDEYDLELQYESVNITGSHWTASLNMGNQEDKSQTVVAAAVVQDGKSEKFEYSSLIRSNK